MFSTAVDLPSTLIAPRTARCVTRAILTAWGYTGDEELDTVEIVVSELITNAVQHGGARALRLHLHAGVRLRITVSDRSVLQPTVRSLADDADSGRGLQIIAAVVDRWGVDDRGEGKSVWAELSLARAGVSSPPAESALAVGW